MERAASWLGNLALAALACLAVVRLATPGDPPPPPAPVPAPGRVAGPPAVGPSTRRLAPDPPALSPAVDEGPEVAEPLTQQELHAAFRLAPTMSPDEMNERQRQWIIALLATHPDPLTEQKARESLAFLTELQQGHAATQDDYDADWDRTLDHVSERIDASDGPGSRAKLERLYDRVAADPPTVDDEAP